MKNREKFAKEILDIVCNGQKVAMTMSTKCLCGCSIRCENCYFSKYNYPHNQGDCTKNFAHWANSEYKEKKEFSEADKAFVKAIDKLNWFARDKDGKVWGFVDFPLRNIDYWDTDGVGVLRIDKFASATFEPLSWEDEEPTHRSEILGE